MKEAMINILGFKVSIIQLINPLIYVGIAIIFYLTIGRILKILFRRSHNKNPTEQQVNRIKTSYSMIMGMVRYLVAIAVFLAILANFGVNVTSLLAGLGIVTAIMGLALQDMFKDIIAGISIISQGLYEVGDVIEVGGFRGTVVNVGLKNTEVKDYLGRIKIVSNRNMGDLINDSKADTVAEVTVQIPYEYDADKVMNAFKMAKKRIDMSDIEFVTGKAIISPYIDVGEFGVSYKVTCQCKAGQDLTVEPEIRRIIMDELKKEKIIPAHLYNFSKN